MVKHDYEIYSLCSNGQVLVKSNRSKRLSYLSMYDLKYFVDVSDCVIGVFNDKDINTSILGFKVFVLTSDGVTHYLRGITDDLNLTRGRAGGIVYDTLEKAQSSVNSIVEQTKRWYKEGFEIINIGIEGLKGSK